jgi:hypothetical protein
MPIEFRCSGCSKLLRTPDESAGKKARCPHCRAVVDVPGPAPGGLGAGTPSPDPFSPQPAPLDNPFGTSADGAASAPLNPYASPDAAASFTAPQPFGTSARPGLPWERESKSTSTFWRTVKMVMGDPSEAFRMMRRDDGLGDPLIFAMCGGLVGGLISAVYNSLLNVGMVGLMSGIGGMGGMGGRQQAAMGGMLALQIVWNFFLGAVMGTVGTLIAIFIHSAIVHLFLMLAKGANQSFETTVRVMSYVSGTTALLQIIPIIGPFVILIVSVVYEIIGLAEAHETTKGKTALAVLLPLILCCGVVALALGAFMFFAIGEINRGRAF